MRPTAVELVPYDAARHGGLLREWLHRPPVVRWWGDPEAVLADPADGEALILADARPVGYLRWQRLTRAEVDEAGLHEIPDGAVDVDVFIGEPDAIGRGIGPVALRLLVDRLRQDATVPLVVLSTAVENHAAMRAYEKAGFRRHRCYDDPECGPSWLMIAE